MMIRFSKFLMLLVLVSVFANGVSAQDALIGKWEIVAETPQGDQKSVWTFSSADGKISGESVSENSGEATEFKDVKLEGEEVTFSIDIEIQGNELTLELTAQLSGQSLTGNWVALDQGGNELATGDLSGTKDVTEVVFGGKSMDNFRGYKKEAIGGGWKVEDGTLHFDGSGGGDIITKKEYGSFELTFDWKISEAGNSGVMYRVKQGDKYPFFTGVEYQILDNDKHRDGKKRETSAAAMYALYPPGDAKPRTVGEWNSSKIVSNGDKVEHWLNGEKVVAVEIGGEKWKEKIAASKFAKWEKFGKSKRGHIAFQDHGDKVWYRDIKIKAMD